MNDDHAGLLTGSVAAVANSVDFESLGLEDGFENLLCFAQSVNNEDALSACHAMFLLSPADPPRNAGGRIARFATCVKTKSGQNRASIRVFVGRDSGGVIRRLRDVGVNTSFEFSRFFARYELHVIRTFSLRQFDRRQVVSV